MQPNLEQMTYAILVWAVIQIGRDVLSWKTRKALQRSEIKYVTVDDCLTRCAECKAGRAVKDEDLVKMLRLVRSDISKLYSAYIKQLLHSGAPTESIEELLGMEIGKKDEHR
ncbi:hypothetical protein [Geopsychrobacter electrodiphilus]|uniref:hypothetical protein n=1 Tax=Geopsychrobacter electrodiphilus TaxID=225196 RepID=UPI00036C06E3|nr:hypothetical protein [Geopsychrobacter electrodiphilus]